MPHLVISYTKTIEKDTDIQQLVQTVWNAAEKTGLFKPTAIKARAFAIEHYLNANTDEPYVHVDAKLFAGRTQEQKQQLIQQVFDDMAALLPEGMSLSVEAIDIERPNYVKN